MERKRGPEPLRSPFLVTKVLSKREVVLNRGQRHGVRAGQRFMIYKVGPREIFDAATGRSLGYLELVKGTGRVVELQPDSAVIIADDLQAASIMAGGSKNPEGIDSFDDPEIGDRAKPI